MSRGVSPKRKEIERLGIGSSEAAAAIGLDVRKPQLLLYLEKTGLLDPEPFETDDTEWGKLNEPALARFYEYKTGRTLVEANEPEFNEQYPFLFASPDFKCFEEKIIVEAKRSRFVGEYGKPGTDEIPEYVLIQVTHQMIVTGWRHTDVIAQIGSDTPKIYPVPYDSELAENIIQLETEFWSLVQKKIQPEHVQYNHPRMLKVMKRLFKTINQDVGAMTVPEATLVSRWVRAKALKNKLEKLADELEARILGVMGETGTAYLPDGSRVLRIARKRMNPAKEARPDSTWIQTELHSPRTAFEKSRAIETYKELIQGIETK